MDTLLGQFCEKPHLLHRYTLRSVLWKPCLPHAYTLRSVLWKPCLPHGYTLRSVLWKASSASKKHCWNPVRKSYRPHEHSGAMHTSKNIWADCRILHLHLVFPGHTQSVFWDFNRSMIEDWRKCALLEAIYVLLHTKLCFHLFQDWFIYLLIYLCILCPFFPSVSIILLLYFCFCFIVFIYTGLFADLHKNDKRILFVIVGPVVRFGVFSSSLHWLQTLQFICAHTHTHTYTHTHLQHVCTHMHTCMHAHMQACVHACTEACTHVYRHVHTYTQVWEICETWHPGVKSTGVQCIEEIYC